VTSHTTVSLNPDQPTSFDIEGLSASRSYILVFEGCSNTTYACVRTSPERFGFVADDRMKCSSGNVTTSTPDTIDAPAECSNRREDRDDMWQRLVRRLWTRWSRRGVCIPSLSHTYIHTHAHTHTKYSRYSNIP